MLKKELETAVRLAKSAGERILEHYHSGFTAREKIGADNFSEPVTAADIEASEIIVSGIERAFPKDGILSEELPDDDSRLSKERVWIIDPLDGTKGFIEKNGDFAVQIGLSVDGKSVLGVVYLPFYGRYYYAAKGSGAFLVDGKDRASKMHVSEKTEFSTMMLAVSRHHPSRNMHRIVEEFGLKNEVRRGSVGLKIGLIATQVCDLYIHFSPRTKHWDTCAPEIIVAEAGGKLSDLFGNQITYNLRDVRNHNGVIASCGDEAHQKTVSSLAPLLEEFGRKPILSGQL